MKKVNIKKNNLITHQGIFKTTEEANEWIAQQVVQKSWGKPDRWVRDISDEDVSKIIGQLTEDDNGKEYQVYHFAAEYEVEIIDITSEVEAEKAIKAAKEAKKAELVALKGKSLSNAEIKKAVELLIEIWPM